MKRLLDQKNKLYKTCTANEFFLICTYGIKFLGRVIITTLSKTVNNDKTSALTYAGQMYLLI